MTFVEGLVEIEFAEHLANSLELEQNEWPKASAWSRVGNTIDALTLRLNLMSEAQVDEVLEIQEVEGGYFGEVAIKRGFLTSEQVTRILEIPD